MDDVTTLPAYSPTSRCVKCGAVEAYTSYRGTGRCVHGSESGVIDTHQGIENERMHRECRRCGYEWDEAPADAREPARTSTA